MSNSPELALQTAVFSHVQQDAGVQAALTLPVRLYDDPPPSPSYPFVSFGRHQSRPIEGDAEPVLEQELSLHVWSRYGGKAEAQNVLHALREALQTMPTQMNGHVLVGFRTIFSDTLRARDGRVFQAVLRLRVLTQRTINS